MTIKNDKKNIVKHNEEINTPYVNKVRTKRKPIAISTFEVRKPIVFVFASTQAQPFAKYFLLNNVSQCTHNINEN